MAFDWGRVAAQDLSIVARHAQVEQLMVVQMPESLQQIVEKRVRHLADYQNDSYAESYRTYVQRASEIVNARGLADTLTKSIAKSLFKLMAYKDEYEVARLYVNPTFKAQLDAQFEGGYSVSYNLAPPWLSRRNAKGHLIKRQFGPWLRPVFPLLARLKFLRGSSLDVFGCTSERKMERALIQEYKEAVTQTLSLLSVENYQWMLELARLPENVRGFGHVKELAAQQLRRRMADLLSQIMAGEACVIDGNEHALRSEVHIKVAE